MAGALQRHVFSIAALLVSGCSLVVGFDRDLIDGSVPQDARADAAPPGDGGPDDGGPEDSGPDDGGPADGGFCEGVVCDAPPDASCDGTEQIVASATGTCVVEGGAASCNYEETRTDCADSDEVCADGECVDPCEDLACDSPPAATCELDVALTYPATGTCESPGGVAECQYARTETDCELTGQACSAGACVDVDPCEGVTCDTPPAASCEGFVAVTFAASGTCSAPSGAAECSYARTEVDCAATDLACDAGACVDPCGSVSCDTPDAPECEDGFTLTTYAATGTCASPGGVPACSYAPTTTDCAASDLACDAGACVDPCGGVSCETPPAAECEDGFTLTTYAATGTCASPGGVPACSYAPSTTDCGGTDKQCVSGACADPCVGVSCDSPPADFCQSSTVAVTHSAGMCVSPGGTVGCSYPEVPTDCALTSRVCVSGACVDLCDGVTCDAPPAPACVDDGTEEVAAASGSCDPSDGGCDYATTQNACAADEACVAGAGCTACAVLGCANPRCGMDPDCSTFGYNFDFEDWSESDPPFAFTKSAASSFTVVQETTNVSRGSSAASLSTATTADRDLIHAYSAAVTLGIRYTVHAWALDDAPGQVRVSWRHIENTSSNVFSGFSADSSAWQELTASLVSIGGTAGVRLRVYDESGLAGPIYVDDLALTAPHAWTMDGALDGGAFEVASDAPRYVRAGINDDGELYVAHPTVAGQDRFLFVWVGDVDPSATVPAMWAKSGTVAAPAAGGELFVLAQEEGSGGTSCGWYQWDGAGWTEVADTCDGDNSSGLVEGRLALTFLTSAATPAAVPRFLHVASVSYGTNDSDGPSEGTQLPASTTTNGDVDPGEALALHRAAILSGRLGLGL